MAGVPFDPNEHRPFTQREDCMYLDTLRKSDMLRCQVKQHYVKEVPTALLTQDIYKATPHLPHKDFWQRGIYVREKYPGDEPKTHYPPRHRAVDLSLVCADIEKAQPNSITFNTSRRTDPLCPSYKLPRDRPLPEEEPAYPPRDLLRVDDVESGLPQREPLWGKTPPPDRNDLRDIDFSCPSYLRRVVRPLPPFELCRNPLRTDDINDPPSFPGLSMSARSQTNKATTPRNPLKPEYAVSRTTTHPFYGGGQDNFCAHQSGTIGHVEGSRSKWLHPEGEPGMSLFCKDISGASPQRYKGQKPFNLYDPPEVTPIITFHDPADIAGAQAGSRIKKHGRSRDGSQTAR